jgi:magnesium-protoporphyrin IX monomethyl ester (oxidative) cyclase
MAGDVALVAMPFLAVQRPSLALGLFARALRQAGFGVRLSYANLRFPKRIGLDLYDMVAESNPASLVGEWIFSRVAFPEFEAPPGFVRNFLTTNRNHAMQKLGKANYRARFQDARDAADAFLDELVDELLADKPRVVACSSVFQQQCASLALLRRVHERDPEVITLLGGANCEGVMGYTVHKNFPWVDYLVSGEADHLIVPLVNDLMVRGRNIPRSELPAEVLGPASRAGLTLLNGEPVGRGEVHDMDSVAIPDHSDYVAQLNQTSYREYVRPGILLESSRGCWWGEKEHCTFCGLNGHGMKYRAKSAQRVLNEFSQVARETGITNFDLSDNILDVSFFKTVLPQLAELGAPYELFYETKANLSKRQIGILADAGVRVIQPGLESLSDPLCQAMKKGNSTAVNLQLLKWAREYDLYVIWLMLFGVPGEQPEWYEPMKALIPKLQHLQPPTGITNIQWERFSPYHSRADEFGLKLVPRTPYKWIYPVSEGDMADLAYYFDDVSDTRLYQDWPHGGRVQRAVMLACKEWQRVYIQRGRRAPILEGEALGDDRVRVRDTRIYAWESSAVFSGVEAAVLKLCDKAVTEAKLRQEFGDGVSEAALQSALSELERRDLLVRVSGRWISLVVYPQRSGLPAAPHSARDTAAVNTWDGRQFAAFPGGSLDIKRYCLERRAAELSGRVLNGVVNTPRIPSLNLYDELIAGEKAGAVADLPTEY